MKQCTYCGEPNFDIVDLSKAKCRVCNTPLIMIEPVKVEMKEEADREQEQALDYFEIN